MLTFDQLLIVIGLLMVVSFIIARKIAFEKDKKGGKEVKSSDLIEKIRKDFIAIVANIAPIVMENDTAEGREQAMLLLVEMFNDYIDSTDLLTDDEKTLIRLFDIRKILYTLQDTLISQGVLKDETIEKLIE